MELYYFEIFLKILSWPDTLWDSVQVNAAGITYLSHNFDGDGFLWILSFLWRRGGIISTLFWTDFRIVCIFPCFSRISIPHKFSWKFQKFKKSDISCILWCMGSYLWRISFLPHKFGTGDSNIYTSLSFFNLGIH